MRSINFLATLCMALLICSCDRVERHINTNSIKVKVNESGTRALTALSSIQANGFMLDAWVDDDYVDAQDNTITERHFINNASVTYNASAWTISGNPNWIAKVTTQFWAHYPVQAQLNGSIEFNSVEYPYDTFTFNYKMPEPDGTTDASDNFDDIVFAHTTQTFTGSNNTIDLTFYHALAQIRFCVDNQDVLETNGVSIKKIEICDIKYKGLCTYTNDRTFDWSKQDGDYTYGQELTDFATDWQDYTVSGNAGKLCKNSFFIVPQNVNDIKVRLTLKKNEHIIATEKDVLLDYDIKSNNYYTFKLTVQDDFLADVTLVSTNALHQAFDQFVNLEY